MRSGLLVTAASALIAVLLAWPPSALPHNPITTNIIFKKEIAQIVQRKCVQCHSENNLAMALTTYREVRPWARAIREEILVRRMPPWSAVRGYGHFANDLSLNQREMDIMVAWADGGAPSGVPAVEETVPSVYAAAAPVWDHGTPDAVLRINPGHAVEAGVPFAVKRFVVPTGFAAPRRVRAISLKQGDRRVVRHASFYEERTGRWLGGWTPWQTIASLPAGVSHRFPARARIVVEIGYHGAEETVTDSSELGLYFEPSSRLSGAGPKALGLTRAQSAGLGGSRSRGSLPEPVSISLSAPATPLAAGATDHRMRADTTLSAPVALLAVWVNLAKDTRSIELAATSPEGVVTPLLWVKDYRPEWQTPYLFSTPITLPRGTRVTMTAYVANPSERQVTAQGQAWLLATK